MSSIPASFRPLPGRANIVVSRTQQFEGCKSVATIDEAVSFAADCNERELMIIGGSEIYKQLFERVAPPAPAPVSPAAPAPAPVSGTFITSPFVGTFYRSSSPDTPSFVEVGTTVQRGPTLCIVEAMKLFNELKAEFPCVIEAVLLENAQPVEYGSKLYRVRKL